MNLGKPEPPDGLYSEYDWDKTSLGVIANDGQGHGCVLWAVGGHLVSDLQEVGRHLSDIGLDDAPLGITVWEGKHVVGGYNAYQGDYRVELVGEFRSPTDEEWQAIRENRCPWDDKLWFTDKAQLEARQRELDESSAPVA